MDTKKTKALLLALEKGSLTAAAEELGYTQSGLTHMMNSLEDEAGIRLLVRSKGGVRLSPAGEALLPRLRELTECAEELEREIEVLREQKKISLRLGTYSSIARRWMPAILTQLRDTIPELDVSITVQSIQDTYSAVKQELLDCAIVSYQKTLSQGLVWIPLRDDRMVAVLPEDYDCEGDSFAVERFTGEKFLMPSAGFELDVLPVLNRAGRRANPQIRYTNLDDAATASMVSHGLGVSIMSDLIMECIDEDVKVMPLDPPAWRQLGIIVSQRRKSDRSIKLLIRCAQSKVGPRQTG
ncbi:MAG: LysR family transcriptional regulator [Oscillospiraceae bacterium]|nr:LysR family transcriptional regulator [Oscillospiraceae bacterium]